MGDVLGWAKDRAQGLGDEVKLNIAVAGAASALRTWFDGADVSPAELESYARQGISIAPFLPQALEGNPLALGAKKTYASVAHLFGRRLPSPENSTYMRILGELRGTHPEHYRVLRANLNWYADQLDAAKAYLFGTTEGE